VRLLADESVDRIVLDGLRHDGHALRAIRELQPGMPDDAVLELARREGLPLITEDKDFGELVFRERRASAGVILVRLAGVPRARKAEIVAAAFRRHGADFQNAFAVIGPHNVRISRAMPLPHAAPTPPDAPTLELGLAIWE
jgi:predicted nuclease of predicted toxin-antitoxin system